jgi:putative endonuclease
VRSTAVPSRRSAISAKTKLGPGSARPESTRAVGNRAERRALWQYRLRGYRILATNAWAGGYELDLVVRRGRTIVFCEVKAKAGDRHGDPLEMVTPEKERRIRRAAEAWLLANPSHRGLNVEFEVLAVRSAGAERVQAS